MATSLLFSPCDTCCFHRFLLSTRASHDLVSMLHAFMSRLHISLKRSRGAASAPCPQWQARRRVDPWGCVHRPSCEHGPASVAGARFRFVNGRCHFLRHLEIFSQSSYFFFLLKRKMKIVRHDQHPESNLEPLVCYIYLYLYYGGSCKGRHAPITARHKIIIIIIKKKLGGGGGGEVKDLKNASIPLSLLHHHVDPPNPRKIK